MDESRLWGTLGILLAIAGLVIIAPELTHAFGGESDLGTTILALYGVGVVVAVLVTLAIIGPDSGSFFTRRDYSPPCYRSNSTRTRRSPTTGATPSTSSSSRPPRWGSTRWR